MTEKTGLSSGQKRLLDWMERRGSKREWGAEGIGKAQAPGKSVELVMESLVDLGLVAKTRTISDDGEVFVAYKKARDGKLPVAKAPRVKHLPSDRVSKAEMFTRKSPEERLSP